MYRLDTFSPSAYLESMDNTELRAWRKDRGMTQQAASSLLGVSLITYKRWERGDPQQYPRLLDLAIGKLEVDLALAPGLKGRPKKPVDTVSQ